MPRTREYNRPESCPCGGGTIVHWWRETDGRRSGPPDRWTEDTTEDGPTTPCAACGCTDATDCPHAPEE